MLVRQLLLLVYASTLAEATPHTNGDPKHGADHENVFVNEVGGCVNGRVAVRREAMPYMIDVFVCVHISPIKPRRVELIHTMLRMPSCATSTGIQTPPRSKLTRAP